MVARLGQKLNKIGHLNPSAPETRE
jgi:hypothetical protein